MQALLLNLIGTIAVTVGVKSTAKKLLTAFLNSGQIREWVRSTDTTFDDSLLDLLVDALNKNFDSIWDAVMSRKVVSSPLGGGEDLAAAFAKELRNKLDA